MRMAKIICGCLVFCVLVGLVLAHQVDTLQDTSPEAFPFHALVKATKTCSGILISKHFIIVPAVCIYGAKSASVYLGFEKYPFYTANLAQKNTQIITCTEFKFHDDFAYVADGYIFNNIALIKLSEPAVLSTNIQPGKIITSEEYQHISGKYVNVTGWMISVNSKLKVAEVLLRNQDICNYLFGAGFKISQEMCVKWSSENHLNLLGNPVSINGKILGFQTLTPQIAVRSSTATRNDMILNLFPFLDWISRYSHISMDQFTQSNDHLQQIDNKILNLQESIHHTTKLYENFNKRLDNISDSLQQKQQQDSRTKLNLDEQVRDMKTELRNNLNKQNETYVKLQEELGGARTEISNGLAAQKAETDSLATRIKTENQILEQMQIDLKETVIQVNNNTVNINKLDMNLKYLTNEVENMQHIGHKWELEFKDFTSTLKQSMMNISEKLEHRSFEFTGKLNEFSSHFKQIENKFLHLWENMSQDAASLGIRLGLIEHVIDESRARLDKQILEEKTKHSLILMQQHKLKESLDKCCWSDDVPTSQ